MFERISIIGLGYIGLPTAAILASRQKQVIGVDIASDTVEVINRGDIHIQEPELDVLVHEVVKAGYLRATTTPEPADAFIIAVPTPFTQGYQPDISFVRQACRSIAGVLKKGDLVVLESTSPVGTTEEMARLFAELRPDLAFPLQAGDQADVQLAYCPERVLPGKILSELVGNDRVLGGISRYCSERAEQLYRIFVQGECVRVNARTAELCKLVENSFRDVNIAFANELSMICDQMQVDVWELIRLANRHPRVNILDPGPGVGGHCIAIDPWFIVSAAPEQARLIRAAREVNDSKPEYVVTRLAAEVARIEQLREPSAVRVAFLGLSYKANIDDTRASPAVEVVNRFVGQVSADVMVVEPNLQHRPQELSERARLTSLDEAVESCDLIAVLVGHDEFRSVQARCRDGQVVLDVCGLFEK